MSQDVLSQPRAQAHKDSVKHCRSCWRKDIHKPAQFSPFVFGFLTMVTLGLFLVFRPTRCVCCGTMRVL